MVDGIDKTFGCEQIILGVNVVLQRKHVRDRKLSPRFQHVINALRAPRCLPFRADGIGIAVWRDAPIRSRDHSRRRIVDTRQLVKGNVARPFVSIVGPAHRQTAITGGANRNMPRGLVTDVAIHIGINHVLPRCIELRKRLAEFLPVLRTIDIEKWHVQAVIERPAQRNLPRLSGQKVRDDRPVPRDLYVQGDVRLTFDVDHLGPVRGLLPALRRLVCTLRVEVLDKCVRHRGPNISESPGDSLIVANDHVRHSGQRHSRHIQIA